MDARLVDLVLTVAEELNFPACESGHGSSPGVTPNVEVLAGVG